MTRWKLTIRFTSDWHAGSGRTSGADLDSLVALEGGLPYVSGRHLRGLLRHSMRRLEALGAIEPTNDGPMSDRLFGRGAGTTSVDPVETRFETTKGRLRVGAARLPEDWRAFARTPDGAESCALLRRGLHSTSLEAGVVKQRTLRSLEVAVPMTLAAELSGELEPQDLAALALSARTIPRLGGHRTRGLGRCDIALQEET